MSGLDEVEELLRKLHAYDAFEDRHLAWLFGLVREADGLLSKVPAGVFNWGMEEAGCTYCGAFEGLRGRIQHKADCSLKNWLARLEKGPE